MWDDETPRGRKVAAWLDAPMDLDDFYGRPRYRRCALVLSGWLALYVLPPWLVTRRALRMGGRLSVGA